MICEKIKDWLKEQDSELIGKIAVCGIDDNKEKYVGIYPDTGDQKERICIGHGETYQDYKIVILVHWTQSATEAHVKAESIRQKLLSVRNAKMDDTKVLFCIPCKEPIPNGVNTRGIREFVVKATVYVEKNKEV